MTGPLAGLVALVTGGSRGIGRGAAEALAAAGADVCVAARHAGDLEAVRGGLGGRAMAVALDVADRGACFAAVDRVVAEWGRVDILVNGAGIYRSATFLNSSIEDFQALMAVNLYGMVHMMQAVLPGMQARGCGRVINIASLGGRTGSPNQSAYNVSKHGIVGLTRCVALEMAKTGVTVNAVCPGLVETEMFEALVEGQSRGFGVPAEKMRGRIVAGQPIGRFITPAEIGSLVAYLASPGAAGLTGQSILYDGGTLFG